MLEVAKFYTQHRTIILDHMVSQRLIHLFMVLDHWYRGLYTNMTQMIKKITSLSKIALLSMIFVLDVDSSVMLSAQDQVTTTITTFSNKGTILPYQLNPKSGEYITGGIWNLDVNEGKVKNFTADMQFEVYNESNPHSHQLMNFRQA